VQDKLIAIPSPARLPEAQHFVYLSPLSIVHDFRVDDDRCRVRIIALHVHTRREREALGEGAARAVGAPSPGLLPPRTFLNADTAYLPTIASNGLRKETASSNRCTADRARRQYHHRCHSGIVMSKFARLALYKWNSHVPPLAE